MSLPSPLSVMSFGSPLYLLLLLLLPVLAALYLLSQLRRRRYATARCRITRTATVPASIV